MQVIVNSEEIFELNGTDFISITGTANTEGNIVVALKAAAHRSRIAIISQFVHLIFHPFSSRICGRE